MDNNINELFNPIDLVSIIDGYTYHIHQIIKKNNLCKEYEEILDCINNSSVSSEKLLDIIENDSGHYQLIQVLKQMLRYSMSIDTTVNDGLNWLIIKNLFRCLRRGDIIKGYHKINSESNSLNKVLREIKNKYFNQDAYGLDDNGHIIFSNYRSEEGEYLINCEESNSTKPLDRYSLIVFNDKVRFIKYMNLYEKLIIEQYNHTINTTLTVGNKENIPVDLLHSPIISRIICSVLGKKYYAFVMPKILLNDSDILDNYVDKLFESGSVVNVLQNIFRGDIYNLIGWGFLDNTKNNFCINKGVHTSNSVYRVDYRENIMIPVICDISLSEVCNIDNYKGVIREWITT